MGTETEIKVKIDDADVFYLGLQGLNPGTLSTRHFEDNCLLDFEDGRLQNSSSLIRIRKAAGQGFLTFKGPPREEGIFKIREELETRIEDSEIAIEILLRLRMRIVFRYQKYRREFTVGEVTVAVDETPIGNYAEFEGPEGEILNLAGRMGIAPSQFLRSSYYSLYIEYCQKEGKTPGFMVF